LSGLYFYMEVSMKDMTIRFTETADEEVRTLFNEMQLIPVASFLQKNDAPLPEELKTLLRQLLATLSDLFSSDLPGIEADPEAALRTASRDINLAKLLRERGLFRLYRILHEKVWYEQMQGVVLTQDQAELVQTASLVPIYMTYNNPSTGSPFSKQEEFIGWFCEEAHVARSLVFMRLATIERALALGFSLEESFSLVISKPYAIQETLHQVGKSGVVKWDGNELASIDPAKAILVARRVNPDLVPAIENAITSSVDDDELQDNLRDAVKPVLADLLTQVANHERAKDAMDYVKHDILFQPEITYEWDHGSKALIVHLVRKEIDPQSGIELASPQVSVPFVPDAMSLPDEIVDDLLRRLPIRNRYEL
jgi:hypothetical protein